MKDLTERRAVYLDDAIDAIVGCTNCGTEDELRAYVTKHSLENGWSGGIVDALDAIEQLPSAQRDGTDTNVGDMISRQAAIELIERMKPYHQDADDITEMIANMPSAEPEQRCVNCGRTANNGGWYADGRTRCPIEEHYALPKDGYCHLWEKRNVSDDDYPERREE